MDFSKGIDTKTISLTDYRILANKKVAKVIIAFTGSHTKATLTEALAAQLKYLANPIENSFRIIKAGVAVGFVRANRAVRTVTNDKEIRAGYKVMSSNILMDNADKTLWEVKNGAGGRYLARHGNEDLSELINASVNERTGIPRIGSLTMATAAVREFVAYAADSGDMEYGFCTAVSSNNEKIRVVTEAGTVTVAREAIASIHDIQIPAEAHHKITAAGISRADKNQQIEYYTKLFSYAPDYLRDIKEMIESTATV